MKKIIATLALSLTATTSFAHNHDAGDGTVNAQPKSHAHHQKMQEHREKMASMSFEEKKAWAGKHLQRMADYVHKKQACVDAASSEEELMACKGKKHHP